MALPRSAVPRWNAFRLLRRCRNSRPPLLLRPLSSSSSPLPISRTCPEPTCACAPTPPMPDGLPIDHEHPLNATMAAYTQQVLISTGKQDWTSRIEEDGVGESWGSLARGLKGLVGRGGKYADPYNNVVVTNSSFSPSANPSSRFASAFLFPAFKYVPFIPVASSHGSSSSSPSTESEVDLETFVRAMLLPHELHPAHSAVPESRRGEMTRAPELVAHFPDMIDIKQSPTILICGHGGRDMRCGIMGPVLRAEFKRVLEQRGFGTNQDENNDGTTIKVDGPNHANIGLISHIGGHKYAGNVIIYIPPGLMTTSSSSSSSISTSPNPLAGKGIWYGRVEPKHVEGIVEETIFRGRVVADHFRGAIGMEGEIYRL
ncbi:hypothetical protein VTN77DRAFT_7200 [Rasamsonia byssochlamydoides]|uniref:uncharacterized protein n=1 Tax=Rasamsonia byssochlamydoides TaxID=89139 RepID=UPI003742BC5E